MKIAVLTTWKLSFTGCQISLESLEKGLSVSESLMQGMNDVEDREGEHSVCYGGYPDERGHVTCDAGYMDGDTLHFGAAACLEGFRSPIRIAHSLMDGDSNNFLAGEGAVHYAEAHHFEKRNNLTKEAEQYWKLHRTDAAHGHDTVCFLVKKDHHLAAGTSTSGLAMKKEGRIGDTPIPGSGYYADSLTGAAAATGMGEEIMKGCLSFAAVMYLREGYSPQQAADRAVENLDAELKRRNGHAQPMSLIVMDKDGNYGIGTNTPFTFCYGNDEMPACLFEALPGENGAEIRAVKL